MGTSIYDVTDANLRIIIEKCNKYIDKCRDSLENTKLYRFFVMKFYKIVL